MSKRKLMESITKFCRVVTHLFKKCRIALAILVLTMAIIFSVFRALTPWANQYKGDVEKHLSTLLGQPVTISDLQTSWYWFEPVLKMDQVTVSDNQDHVLKFNKLLVGINILSSLWHWQIQPGVLYVDDAHLTLRQINNHWEVDGLSQPRQVMTLGPSTYLPVLSWLLSQQKIIIKNVSALVYLNDGSLLPLSNLNVTIVQSYGHYRLKGGASLVQTNPTTLSIIADMQIDPYALSKTSGHAYLSLKRVSPTQWQGFLPSMPYHIKSGQGNLELWLDLTNGALSGLQSRIKLKHVAWTEDGKPKQQFVKFLNANLAWTAMRDGWRLSADKIKLGTNGINWPENTFQIDYKKSQQIYRIFVKTVLLRSALATNITLPEILQPILAMNPRGELHDAQIVVKDSHLDYFLARFAHLGWQGRAPIPDVSQMSGVVFWQPTEGRLELDGENTVIKPSGLPAVTFDLFNVAFEWKALSNGFRTSMERFVLSHPSLILSARGALDDPFSPTSSHLRMTAEFSAKNAQQWLAYLPSQYLKPKLNRWLKHDVKRIDKASAQLIVDGSLAGFPYDQQPGQFSITSHVSGVDLLITKRWPLNRDIDADLLVNKRILEANIFNAELQDILVDKLNLVINDIGLGKEALLIHGSLNAPASKIKHYVFDSPLHSRLLKWQKMDIQDALGLDLQLEIPLYPESDHVLAQGVLTFDQNQVLFHHTPNDLAVDKVSGMLQFNEFGITDGGLKGTIAGEPIEMIAHYELEPKPHTDVSIDAKTTAELLRKTFSLPLLALMEGSLKLQSLVTLNLDPKVSDHIHIASTLEGSAIHLPEPFGKSSEQVVPLAIDLECSPEKTVNVLINYDNRLSSDLWFKLASNVFLLEKGVIRLGEGQATLEKQAGVDIIGSLPIFDVSLWHHALSQIPTDASPIPRISGIQSVDVRLGELVFLNQRYNDLGIKAKIVADDDWSIKLAPVMVPASLASSSEQRSKSLSNDAETTTAAIKLNQATVLADLHYKPTTNLLFGNVEHLSITKPTVDKTKINSPNTVYSPKDIPSLNVIINELTLNDVDVGQVTLKSTSTKAQWKLDSFLIKTPEYQLMMQSDWTQNGKHNNSTLAATLRIDDLAKSLERWHITPVVQAHRGDIRFNGGWPGAINDFSLGHVNGTMQIVLKDGRITHLDRDTEEKLGLGRLLSILSLQTIPRRLKLDFSDLSERGYSFDLFKGSFQLKNGVMNTDDSYIDGPVAYASMKGSLDLVKRLYDVDLRVSPYITASLPIVATIAGGPIAGIATWVASKIINKGMQKISAYTYKVSGPWLNPVVQQVSIVRK